MVRCSYTCFLRGLIVRIRAEGWGRVKKRKSQKGGKDGEEEVESRGERLRQRKGMTKHRATVLFSGFSGKALF